MKIYTYGNKNNEKILLLHPMFTSVTFFETLINNLSNKYYLIIPTLSGHYENSTYKSMQDEQEILNNYFKDNNIDKLKIVIGFSLGGNIAFDYFCKNSDKIDKVIVDSAPIFKFPLLIKLYFYNKYKKCLLAIHNNPENIVEELNKHFHGMGKVQQQIAPLVTLNSLRNLIESCYNLETPRLETSLQEKITFLYGSKDIAKLCLPRIKKYKNSNLIILDSLNHCEYFMINQEDYIKKIIN